MLGDVSPSNRARGNSQLSIIRFFFLSKSSKIAFTEACETKDIRLSKIIFELYKT